jgi:hypothetical protein
MVIERRGPSSPIVWMRTSMSPRIGRVVGIRSGTGVRFATPNTAAAPPTTATATSAPMT